jgi:hypothetical protein
MKKLVVVTTFAAFAFAAQSAVACEWNREASAADQAVAVAVQPPQATATCNGSNCQAPQPTSSESEQTRQGETAPVVLVTHRD